MAIKVVELPLYEEFYYSYTTVLEGNAYSLEFLYLERIKDWIITLKDSEKNILVAGQRLTPETELFFSYKLPNLSGYFYLKPNAENQRESTSDKILNLSKFHNLLYTYDDGE